jgi:ribosomal protein S18 acetylase RimI-like enzyme
VIAAIEDNALGWLDVFERLPGARRSGCAVASELDHPLCNSVVMAGDDADVDAMRAFGGGRAQLWWVRATTPGLAARLDTVAVRRDALPGMALALDGLDPGAAPPPDGVSVEQVGPLGLRHFVEPFADAFGFDRAIAVPLVQALARSDADLMHWVAYEAGRPVGCASVLVHGGVAGLYNVGVPASSGRRGIGAALTVRALATARARGLEHAILHASAAGLPIYERLGFETHGTLRTFVTPPASPAGTASIA